MSSKYTEHWAEPIITSHCGPARTTSKYIASFTTPGGLALALDRTPKLAQVWLTVPPDTSLSMADVIHYLPTKSRNSNLRNQAKTLWAGNNAWHVKVRTPAELDGVLSWYCGLAEGKEAAPSKRDNAFVAVAKALARWLDWLIGRLKGLSK